MMQSKIIIGLTGGSGCGKSIVAKAGTDLGFVHIDTDILGHNIILKPNKAYYEIIEAFGSGILKPDGEIDRKKLGKIVFSDSDKLNKLCSITHPQIVERVKDMLGKFSIIDGAVIHQTKDIVNMCDYIIAVTNFDERRIEFICNRDNISAEMAENRIKSQPDNDFYSKFADITIHSDCSADELYNKSIEVIKRCMSEKNI